MIYMHGSQQACLVGTTVSGQYTIAAIDAGNFGGAAFLGVVVNNTGTGPDWVMPSSPGKITWCASSDVDVLTAARQPC